MKWPLPKLSKWLIRQFVVFSSIFFVLVLVSFFVFFKESSVYVSLLIFFMGFVFCACFSLVVFVRVFYPLSRAIKRVENINDGKRELNTKEELYLDDEPGELYDLNRSLNQIHNYLRWQKRIISQETSELEAVISALTGAILAVDQNKKVLFFNNQATLLFSSKRRLQKSEIYLSEIVRNPDILQAYAECLKQAQVIRKTVSFSIFETEEEPFVYEVTVAPFKAGHNLKAGGAVALFYDITNIRKTEKIQLDFITNVSHELRTPLTAIQGYVETLLQEENLAPKQSQQFLSIIQRNVKRLVSLLNHFLELSQMEEPLALKKDTLNTEEVTQSIVKDLHIKKHKLKLSFSQKTVKADRHFLKQILYNLINNAIKYTPKDTLIEVLWLKQDSHVILQVKDKGFGISKRHKSRLFERFYRVDPSRASIKGAGIGLSIVKQLVEKHGGTVKLESTLNKGSAFICSFPD